MLDLKQVNLLYGKTGLTVKVPANAYILECPEVPSLPDIEKTVYAALANPIESPSLEQMIKKRKPQTVAITISDITRPVPNRVFLPVILNILNRCGIRDSQIAIIVGTGMHRPSTAEEHCYLVGADIMSRVAVVDHHATDVATLKKVCDDPPVSVCRQFAEADFKIVTGYIEAHFMAGFSGGRKGVCPALVDLQTIRNFHGYGTLCSPYADTGNLQNNPCHEIALKVAHAVGVDFLFNVAINNKREIAGIFCGELNAAHLAGCKQVAAWTTAKTDGPYDLVITNGGGYPLDQTFYQTVKGMCTALPAIGEHTVLLQASACNEGLGSKEYANTILRYGHQWQKFLSDISDSRDFTVDQWQFQMQTRVISRIGIKNLWFVTDGIEANILEKLCLTPVYDKGNASTKLQQVVDRFVSDNPCARIAVIPEGPYTILK
ncbi:MAG TPA: nickel-dependent lactate racemase [Phycisphaerae bacterium]|nr:nickel-dependent lactate racemase [Phycisphaerae bacterium]